MEEETTVYKETGSISINERKKTISIRYPDEIVQYPINERVEDGGELYYYSVRSGSKGIGQYVLRHNRSNNYFSVSIYDSYAYDFKRDGYKSTKKLVALIIFELGN